MQNHHILFHEHSITKREKEKKLKFYELFVKNLHFLILKHVFDFLN